MMRSLYLILVVFVSLGVFSIQTAGHQSNLLNTRVSNIMQTDSDEFLALMKSHFDISLDYLFTGNAYNGRTFELPGMGKLLRDQSDRHWDLGVATLKKYIQRGGKTFPDFTDNFTFQGTNAINSTHKVSADFSSTYLSQIKTLVSNSHTTSTRLNAFHHTTTKRAKNTLYDSYDADIAHHLEEQMEEEVVLMRKFSNLYTNLYPMRDLGMAVHFFDKNL